MSRSVLPILDPSITPPGHWQFFQPATGWQIGPPWSFDVIVDKIIDHHKANPQHNLPTDRETVEKLVAIFNCARIDYDPRFCKCEPPAQVAGANNVVGVPAATQPAPKCKTCGQS